MSDSSTMSGFTLPFVRTQAGIDAAINAERTGGNRFIIDRIDLGSGKFRPGKETTALEHVEVSIQNTSENTELIQGQDTGDGFLCVCAIDPTERTYDVNEIGIYATFTDQNGASQQVLFAVWSDPDSAEPCLQKTSQSQARIVFDWYLGDDAEQVTFPSALTFDNPYATTTTPGIAEIADWSEVQAGVDGTRFITPAQLRRVFEDAASWHMRFLTRKIMVNDIRLLTDMPVGELEPDFTYLTFHSYINSSITSGESVQQSPETAQFSQTPPSVLLPNESFIFPSYTTVSE